MSTVPARPWLPLPYAALVAIAAGPILDSAFPATDVWPLAFLGIALALLVQQGRRLGGAFLVGFLFNASFMGIQVFWTTEFLGPLPWGALVVYEGVWGGAGGILLTLAYRWIPRAFPSVAGRLLLLPAVVAGLWTLREAVHGVWPWGGFAWGRVALSQSGSPLRHLFAWVGISGVSFLMVFGAAVLIAAVQLARPAFRAPAPGWAARAALVTAVALVLVVVPAFPLVSSGTLRVGAVQGDTKAGYFDPPKHYGDNLIGQADATVPVLDQHVDVVVWPEGGSDVDPLEDPQGAEIWQQVAEAAGAPLVAGTFTTRKVDGVQEYFNTSLMWDPAVDGPTDHYDKKHPVPFGEYIPERPFFHAIVPWLTDLIQREFTPGTTDDVMDVGKAVASIAICFDIVDDQIMTDGVREGGQLVLAQTNNADFGRDTDESVQQLAIARIRAQELGRTVVNVSTVGTSAIIFPDGSEHDRLPTYTPGVMVADVPLSTTMTPAVIGGRQIEWLVSGLGIGALVAGFLGTRRPRRRTR